MKREVITLPADIRKATGIRSGPLTPWERLKVLAYANTLADECGMKEQHIAALKAQAKECERLLTALDAGQITKAEVEQQLTEILKTPPPPMEHELNTEIGRKLIQQTKTNAEQQRDFVTEVQNAKMALELAVTTFRKATLDYLDEMGKYLGDVRQTRVALGQETKQLLAGCEDVRKFFLSPEHTTEVQRLKEFVEVCERLKSLKESGFLDSVADTILKLEAK